MDEGMNKHGDAIALYKRMAGLGTDNSNPSSLHGFALLFSGKKAEAVKWADDMVRDNNDTDGSINYMAACLYAQAGESDKALQCLETSLNKGYANRYNITMNDDARVNIAPIRKGTALTTLLSNYSYIFE